jgi:1-hydroxycarotenoid 3,4-desaturase
MLRVGEEEMPDKRVTIVGAGFGGLSAALSLVADGWDVTVFESADAPGGKARLIDGVAAGPTVMTMKPIFDALFARLGERVEDHVTLSQTDVIARHFWDDGSRLDLFADAERSRDAVGQFAGLTAVKGFDAFRDEAKRIHDTLEAPFMKAPPTNPIGLSWRIGLANMGKLRGIRPWETMWSALGRHFPDPRLRQLFGRYATYTGSSPFAAPATLMLIAHVETLGVWLIDGGVQRLAAAMANVAEQHGVRFHYGQKWDGRVNGPTVFNGDPAIVGKPLKPSSRSLSAMVWTGRGDAGDFPLAHHNVFFSTDYAREFDQISRGQIPADPTIYVCAQDRDGGVNASPVTTHERFQFIVNAPANGDTHIYSAKETEPCHNAIVDRFRTSGLTLDQMEGTFTTPSAFETRFPGSGGALYGRATHGAFSAFIRPGPRCQTPNLYLTGGSTHPGAGVPMATLSGLQAASALLEDHGLTRQLHPVAMPGGISTPSAMTGSTA